MAFKSFSRLSRKLIHYTYRTAAQKSPSGFLLLGGARLLPSSVRRKIRASGSVLAVRGRSPKPPLTNVRGSVDSVTEPRPSGSGSYHGILGYGATSSVTVT